MLRNAIFAVLALATPAAAKEGFDSEYERMTDEVGVVSFTPKTGNVYLIMAHHQLPRSGQKFENTKYSATMTLLVPEICPCCEE